MKRLIVISATFLATSSAFAQSRCVTAPINMTGSQVTLTSSGSKSVTKEQVYVYYSRRHHRRHDQEYPVSGISDRYPSMPILLRSEKDVKALPEAYNVTITTPQSNVAVCPDSTLNLAANINVEKVSSYTGNYPGTNSDNKVYNKVSKREYKMIARKMRKIKRNEDKIARRSGLTVEARSNRA
ncbi:MAG: hypothetical protein P4L41_10385 [Flavipsychrobacter sp.]|nr:hypothetical protein [Flavipsychrobacter sp.]